MTKQETIEEMTRRLVEFYRRVRIYLFGSEARGDAGPDSDLDFCVVLPEEAPESLYRDRSIHNVVWGLHAAIDVVRLANSDFEKGEAVSPAGRRLHPPATPTSTSLSPRGLPTDVRIVQVCEKLKFFCAPLGARPFSRIRPEALLRACRCPDPPVSSVRPPCG